MRRRLALIVALAALVLACSAASSPSLVPDVITTAPPSSPTLPTATEQQSLPPASFPDQTVLPSGVASDPPLVMPELPGTSP